jgi:hypothetical protein
MRSFFTRAAIINVLILLVISVFPSPARAAEMLQGGPLEPGDISSYWTIVETGRTQVVSGETGYVNLCLGLINDRSPNLYGDAYIYQTTTGSILSSDVVQLSF